MADVTLTANLIRPLPGAIIERFPANGTGLTPGTVVYLLSTGKVELADADAAASALPIGVVVSVPGGKNTVAANDMVDVCMFGRVTGYSGMTIGTLMYSSVTAGKVADARPAGSSGDFVGILGVALSATDIFINPFTDIFTAL